ncbi:MAG: PD40 domain-containing protein [Planctomycetes bacterium]|nr:PD40 domain-containing protein [Planctomycetota bacterium]
MTVRAAPLYLAACLSVGCYPSYEIVQREAPIPVTPWNLTELNSPYDDRNAAAPPSLHVQAEILFSSGRASQDADLDLVPGRLWVEFGQWNAEYRVDARVIDASLIAAHLSQPGSNERGPRILPGRRPWQEWLYLFASDRAGSYDVYACYGPRIDAQSVYDYRGERAYPDPEPPAPVPGLCDPELYEAYVSPLGDDRVLYATDRGGAGLDLYQARLRTPGDLPAGVVEHARVDALSSEGNDSFPYVNGDVLVFASDRPGGFGGYDLYRARFDGSGWSAPENLGPGINTEHDERRPVFVRAEEFTNDLLLFSSDRPGGLGGFDLYAVGVSFARDPASAAPAAR